MGLSNGRETNNGALVFLNPRAKNAKGEKVSPHFEVARVVDGKITKTEETATQVNGNLVKIEFKEREFKGIKNKHVVLYIRDDAANETYSLDLTYNLPSRSLFNGLAGMQSFDNISVSYYESKKGYATYALQQNGERVDWKFKLEELPQPIKVMFKGKEQSDFQPLDDFFEKELQEVVKRLGGKSTEVKKESKVEKDDDSSVPF